MNCVRILWICLKWFLLKKWSCLAYEDKNWNPEGSEE